jgi:multiple sugar transport system substrate-binding protein
MIRKRRVSRRRFLKLSAGAAAAVGIAAKSAPVVRAAPQVHEIIHWSWYTASDGDVWKQMIDNFNQAHKDKGVQIKMEVIGSDQYGAKVLSTAAAGNPPDFGVVEAGLRADWIKKGITLPMDDIFKQISFDLTDFTEQSLRAARYTKFGNKLYMLPFDVLGLQILLNVDHAQEAGLDPNKLPQTGDELLVWADKMTKRQGDKVTRSGWLMTGSGLMPSVVWGVVAHQMGFRRASDDLTRAALNPEAGERAAQWVLDLYDKHKVSSRDVTDRYKTFGTAGASMFLTGPWTLAGYMQQKLNFISFPMVKVGNTNETYFEMGGVEMYVQKDKSRYEQTAQAIKWLSDNSFLWVTVGRTVPARKSILNRPDFKTAGLPWKVRRAFVEGMPQSVVGEIPVLAASDFTIYTASDFVPKTMDPVWAKQANAHDAIGMLKTQWQKDLDAG